VLISLFLTGRISSWMEAPGNTLNRQNYPIPVQIPQFRKNKFPFEVPWIFSLVFLSTLRHSTSNEIGIFHFSPNWTRGPELKFSQRRTLEVFCIDFWRNYSVINFIDNFSRHGNSIKLRSCWLVQICVMYIP
jgi:hypothetical protein